MIGRPCLVLVVLATSVGCADDGNDAAYQARRASALAAERRAATEPAGDPATARAVEPTGVVVPVFALDNSFRPEIVEISVGDEVLWENRGRTEHDLLYVETGEWGVEAAFFQPGDVYSRVFTEPGEYDYYCTIHGTAEVGMIGTVIVRE